MNVKTDSAEDTVAILVVEDSRTQAEQLKSLLEQKRYRVTAAENGKQALALLGECRPTLVITDIIMPEMNGYELCKRIKSDEKTEGIPVILLTALTNSEDVIEGLACGADNFITKPYSEEYLLSSIEKILAGTRLRKSERVRIGVEISFGGKSRFITADQQQMLSLLISTYEAAVHRNNELVQTQGELRALTERLEDRVEERTAALSAEIVERKRAQEAINEQLDELRRWHEATMGRETRVIDLKREVNELLAKAGQPARYGSVVSDQ
jgi:DNA-binding response OmpR family regulator